MTEADVSLLTTKPNQTRCNPKTCLEVSEGVYPMVLAEVEANVDCVLIDDDSLVRLTWNAIAKRKGLNLEVFHTLEEFLDSASELNRAVPIYIDSHLGGGLRGEAIARSIHELGFSTIVLTTGRTFVERDRYPWIQEVMGKEPPF